MATINHELLQAALMGGGPSVVALVTELEPAGGPQSSVAPARFVSRRGQGGATYAYERRFIDGEARQTVIIDSKQSQLNRAEAALQQALDDGNQVLARLPHVTVTYERDGSREVYTDLTLPHRLYDGHVRAGTIEGVPVTQTERYRAARNATPQNARVLLELSPVTLVFGGWDASRRSRQGRWRSALVGEIIGVVADQHEEPKPVLRGGARVDPVAMQVQLGADAMIALATAQKDELSPTTFEAIRKAAIAAKKKGDAGTSASALGLGGIPPTLEQLAGVACSRIIRAQVLSLATLRQLRFGAGPEGDAACRALLAALAFNGLARSNAELYLRANCDLVEAGPTQMTVDRRGGQREALEPLDIAAADALLAEAIEAAQRAAGISWSGQLFAVTGNPAVISGALDAEPED